ncbi:hypothetical protein AAFC00_005352 [Neodothiora populina]
MATSTAAARALSESAESIQLWIRNALKVLQGLQADDDVEWAAAAGREGLDDVDKAINRFERVIKVYIFSVDELQSRDDISVLPKSDLTRNVAEMEAVLIEWQRIKDGLDKIKEQVEIAMEWEELWNHVLGAGIGQEMDELARLVFEMEEKRHRSAAFDPADETTSAIDLDDLNTIAEESPGAMRMASNLQRGHSSTAAMSPSPTLGNMEDGLLALFARMQPLRASLDFLPMRLSVFHQRGNPIFPSACAILESRRDMLEVQWKRLESDAEALRRELGEDRWLLVFRNAGRQALKMCESVSRTMDKLRLAVLNREQHIDAPGLARKIESYEAKKTHYAPAIERVLAIVDRGVKDRLTVNGEILGLQSDMKRRWLSLQSEMRELDTTLTEMNVSTRNQQLRDSISTILSSEQSLVSSYVETPRSSSASSVSAQSSMYNHNTPKVHNNSNRLFKSSIPRRLSISQTRKSSHSRSPLTQPLRPFSPTLTPVPFLRQFKPPTDKPRWNGSTSTRGSGIGLNFTPLSATEPSPYSQNATPRRTVTPSSAPSKIPAPSPNSPRGRPAMARAKSPTTPSSARFAPVAALSSPLRLQSRASMDNIRRASNGRATPSSSSLNPRSITAPVPAQRRGSHLTQKHEIEQENKTPARKVARAPSALAVPTGRKSNMATDRGGARSRASGSTEDLNKPRWR